MQKKRLKLGDIKKSVLFLFHKILSNNIYEIKMCRNR